MNLDSIKNIFESFGSVIIQSLNFIINLPDFFISIISFIPDPFRTNLLMYFPIMFGLFIWKLVRG